MNEPPATSDHAGEGRGLQGLHGIDHVGISIPDIEQATAFFVNVLGYELLYEWGPDDSPQDQFGVPPGAHIEVVRSLRCANGANVEPLEFYSPEQRTGFFDEPEKFNDDVVARFATGSGALA